ncbi:MAG TPA: hypothetical protein VF741_01335, partial [Candidatus Aquilonibacter sp.]
VAYGTKIGIDATRKSEAEGYTREWPPDMVMDAPTKELVDKRWRDYGLDTIVKSLAPDDWSGQGPQAYRRKMRD